MCRLDAATAQRPWHPWPRWFARAWWHYASPMLWAHSQHGSDGSHPSSLLYHLHGIAGRLCWLASLKCLNLSLFLHPTRAPGKWLWLSLPAQLIVWRWRLCRDALQQPILGHGCDCHPACARCQLRFTSQHALRRHGNKQAYLFDQPAFQCVRTAVFRIPRYQCLDARCLHRWILQAWDRLHR